jgi:hypothetical protein
LVISLLLAGACTSTLLPTGTTNPNLKATLTTPPAAISTPAADSPLTATPLAIQSFTVDTVDLGEGRRRLTFAWQTSGASSVSIALRAWYRFPPYWGDLPPNGTHVFEGHTLYPNPNAELVAFDSEGNRVEEVLRLDWPCHYAYFFTAETETDCDRSHAAPGLCPCPRYAAMFTEAAEQAFENGRMIWLQGTDVEPSYPDTIVVLYDEAISPEDYRAEVYEDTWTPDQAERDPELTPPPGRYQPIRRFGKLWRENADMRERIGWATAPERGFTGVWQPLESEGLGGDVFLRTIDGQVVLFSGFWMAGGSWRPFTP